MTDDETISQWIDQLKHGDDRAARELWNRYYFRQLGLARKLLGDMPRGAGDEEDVALSAFNSFCLRAADGKFPILEDRDDLWKILATITVRKAGRMARRERRRKTTDAQQALADAVDEAVMPDLAVASQQEIQRLFELLGDDQLRIVAYCKLEGRSNAQIAAAIGKSVPTVERKLRTIRQLWNADAPNDPDTKE